MGLTLKSTVFLSSFLFLFSPMIAEAVLCSREGRKRSNSFSFHVLFLGSKYPSYFKACAIPCHKEGLKSQPSSFSSL